MMRWRWPDVRACAGCAGTPDGREVRRMNQTVRFQEILRRLAIIDEGFAEDQAGLGLGLPASWLLDVFVLHAAAIHAQDQASVGRASPRGSSRVCAPVTD